METLAAIIVAFQKPPKHRSEHTVPLFDAGASWPKNHLTASLVILLVVVPKTNMRMIHLIAKIVKKTLMQKTNEIIY